MEREEHLKLDNQLCFAIYACSREITKLYAPLLKELGLTYTQYVTMLALWEEDRVSVKQLGSRLLLDSGTLTPLLKKLEAQGLVTRTRDGEDERNVYIALTERGNRLREDACGIPEAIVRKFGIPLEDVFALHREATNLLKKMKAANPRG
ncbi:MarR family winged helix-turn-helix transcriptional regulator [Cohnella massiliensis]|uniref:MarR family winged helix-turn-helix transcriptional regulator n=1 Tax=Cohnella massiliensis TaxID=1816691 RepID=UPI0009B94C94|nr:MarR family transcriptional regulator [Cohnella massiliensis]